MHKLNVISVKYNFTCHDKYNSSYCDKIISISAFIHLNDFFVKEVITQIETILQRKLNTSKLIVFTKLIIVFFKLKHIRHF